jgi:deoxyribonuclease-4
MISRNYIGAHIKRDESGGIIETMNNIKNNGGNALQIFVSNPRSITITNIDSYIKKSLDIRKYLAENDFKLVIHAPYTINIAKDAAEGKRVMPLEECIWIKLLINQLTLADMMNAEGVVLHVGKHVSLPYEKGLNNMKNAIEYILKIMENNKMKTKLIIETPAGQGTELLKDLNDFVAFFNCFSKEQKKNLGICFDTAHTWALGYELAEAYNILFKKNSKDITVIHLNNSLVKKGEMKDRHSVILDGEISVIEMNDFIASLSSLSSLPGNNSNSRKSAAHIPTIILETPSNNYEIEINHIRNLLN